MPTLDAIASVDLAAGAFVPVRLGERRLVLVRIDGVIHALEADCPVDGRPLVPGSGAAGELWCEWHGGRFDVRSGRCARGGESIRRFHAFEQGGRVFVKLERPLAEVEQAGLVDSLRTALIENDPPRLARDCVRFLEAGGDPVDIVRVAVRYGAERGRGGFHPALAACADFARVVPLYEGFDRAVPLTQALVAVARAQRGNSQRPIPDMTRGALSGSSERRRALFVRLVEERRSAEAEALLSGALDQGMALSETSQWLLSAACAHVVDGGALLTHTVKALELCDQLGAREGIHLLPPLVPLLADAVRIDALDPLRATRDRLDERREKLRDMAAAANPALAKTFDDRPLREAILSGPASVVFDEVDAALSAGVPAPRVALAVLLSAAERVLRFDDLVEWDDERDERWSDALGPFTYAVSACKAVQRWPSAETLPSVFYAAALVHAAAHLDAKHGAVRPSFPASTQPDEACGAVLAAIRARRPWEAVALARSFVGRGHNPWMLAEALARYCVEDGLPTQGRIETGAAITIAAVDAWEAARGHPESNAPLLVAVRFLASDSRQRWLQRHVRRMAGRLTKGG